MSLIKHTDKWGLPWLTHCGALTLHACDEAAHNFLSVYNPTVRSSGELIFFLPLSTFSYEIRLWGPIAAIAGLLLLSYFHFAKCPVDEAVGLRIRHTDDWKRDALYYRNVLQRENDTRPKRLSFSDCGCYMVTRPVEKYTFYKLIIE